MHIEVIFDLRYLNVKGHEYCADNESKIVILDLTVRIYSHR